MNEYNEHTYSELLSQLLDGELDSSMESDFYREFGSNPELQAELEQNIMIKEAIKGDTEAFTPPAALTSSVFNKLGYSYPYSQPKAFLWGDFFKRTAVPAMIGIFALTSVSLLVNNIISEDKKDSVSSAIPPVVRSIELDNSDALSNDKNTLLAINDHITDDKKVASEKQAQKEERRVFFNVVAKENADNKNSEVNNFNKENVAEENSNIIFATLNNSDFALYELDYSNSSPISEMLSSYGRYSKTRKKADLNQHWTLGLRGTMLPTADFANEMNNADQLGFNTFVVGFYRHTSRDLRIGIEAGRENYNSYSSDLDENLVLGLNEVNWLGFSARFDANDFTFSQITPFVQMSVGSGTGGQIARAMVGFERNLFNDVSFNLSYEGGFFFYSVQNTSYTSKKHGMTIGLNYRF